MNLKGKSVLTWLDYSQNDFQGCLDLASKLKREKQQGVPHRRLEGKQVVLLFQKDSTRTRCAFEVAANDLGMPATYIGSSGSQMGTKESIRDTARVLGRMYQGIEFRGYHHCDVIELSKFANVPVWNGLTDKYHPTQVLADFLTIRERLGHLTGVKLVFVGDSHNNVCNSLMIGASIMGLHFTAVAPKSLWPDMELVKECEKRAQDSGATLMFTENISEGVAGAEVIYTDVWVSMGEPKEIWAKRISLLHKYQVNKQMMEKAGKNAIFLHCLPSFHGLDTEVGRQIAAEYGAEYPHLASGELEVTNEVFESHQSFVFDQAENRLHTIKAIMLATME